MAKDRTDDVRMLPRGAHGLPREVVERNQRERLIAAMAEVAFEKGYGETSVADVARRASVSTASFYKQFADKRECMLASFEELFGRLLGEVERACRKESDSAAKARAGVGIAAQLLAADLPTARLLTVEVLAVGPEGVRSQHAAVERLARLLQVEWAVAAGLVALVARRVVDGEEPLAAELEEACGLR